MMTALNFMHRRLENVIRSGGARVVAEDVDELLEKILSEREPNSAIAERDVFALKVVLSQAYRNACYASAKATDFFEDYEYLLPPLLELDTRLQEGRVFCQESREDLHLLWRLSLEFGRGQVHLKQMRFERGVDCKREIAHFMDV